MEAERALRIAWAAGFFDGEGCITSHVTAKGNLQFHVTTDQRIREPLRILQELFGGAVYEGPGNNVLVTDKQRTMYRHSINGFAASRMLSQMLPYLIVKRDQALLSVKYFQAAERRLNPNPEELYEGLKALKRPWLKAVGE